MKGDFRSEISRNELLPRLPAPQLRHLSTWISAHYNILSRRSQSLNIRTTNLDPLYITSWFPSCQNNKVHKLFRNLLTVPLNMFPIFFNQNCCSTVLWEGLVATSLVLKIKMSERKVLNVSKISKNLFTWKLWACGTIVSHMMIFYLVQLSQNV